MKTPRTIRISKEINKSRKSKTRNKNKYSSVKALSNLKSKKHSNRDKSTSNKVDDFRRRGRRTQRRNYKRVQTGGTSVFPTVLVNVYDSIIHGVSNFVNILQGIEETVSPLPYLDHF